MPNLTVVNQRYPTSKQMIRMQNSQHIQVLQSVLGTTSIVYPIITPPPIPSSSTRRVYSSSTPLRANDLLNIVYGRRWTEDVRVDYNEFQAVDNIPYITNAVGIDFIYESEMYELSVRCRYSQRIGHDTDYQRLFGSVHFTSSDVSINIDDEFEYEGVIFKIVELPRLPTDNVIAVVDCSDNPDLTEGMSRTFEVSQVQELIRVYLRT